jgi:hypothetical protein
VTDTLTEGQKLEKGGSLISPNGAYSLMLQDDGNLVLYARDQAVWSTDTNGQDVVRAEVQTDGNFVLYTPDKPVWHTDTKGQKDVKLVLQDDRNLVLYGQWSGLVVEDGHERAAPARAGRGTRSRTGSRGGGRGAGRTAAGASGVDNPDLIYPGQVLTIP